MLKLNGDEQAACFSGNSEILREKMAWMQNQSDSRQMILAMKGKNDPSYMEIKRLAACLVSVLDALLERGQPMIVVLECDMAKALGQMMMPIETAYPGMYCIDSVRWIRRFWWIWEPLVDGLLSGGCKTLIFG